MIITSQRYLNEDIVAEKVAHEDFDVTIPPKRDAEMTRYHYSAQIDDFETGTVTVTERATNGFLATSGDAVTQADERLTDEQIQTWLEGIAEGEWAAPETRSAIDLEITILRS